MARVTEKIMTKVKSPKRRRSKQKGTATTNGMPKSGRDVPNKTKGTILEVKTGVIWVPAAPRRTSVIKAADASGGLRRTSKLCKACGHKIPPGQFASHKCTGITTTVGRVRKRSTLPGKQRYVKVKSNFTEKLSDHSGGWW
jgi:hypothetical protein